MVTVPAHGYHSPMKNITSLALLALAITTLFLSPAPAAAQSPQECAQLFPYDFDAQYFCYLFGPPSGISSPGMLPPPGGEPVNQQPGPPPPCPPPTPQPPCYVAYESPALGFVLHCFKPIISYDGITGCDFITWQEYIADSDRNKKPKIPGLWMDQEPAPVLTAKR